MTTDQKKSIREQIADRLLADVDDNFDFDRFWYLVDYGNPQIGGEIEDRKAHEFSKLFEAANGK